MGDGKGVDCTCKVCNKIFSAKQSNYKVCSDVCRIIYKKQSGHIYYINNKEHLIEKNSMAKRVKPTPATCIICNTLFSAKKGTTCCGESCRSKLNNIKNKSRYQPSSYKCTCVSCNREFFSSRKKTTCSAGCYQQHKTRYIRNRYKTDIQFKIATNLRSRLNHAIKNPKMGSAVAELGCSVSELISYLESRFLPGMTWDNYGEWHIDHIQPLANFDLTDIKQLKVVCHYSNLQPLWAKDNLIKGNR